MRQRINRNAICSSDNYAASKRLHREYLKNTHEARVANIAMMSVTTSVTNHISRPYVKVWGKKIYIPRDKADVTEQCDMKVYWE